MILLGFGRNYQEPVHGVLQTVVRALSADQIPLPPFSLNLTLLLLQFQRTFQLAYPLFNLFFSSAASGNFHYIYIYIYMM